MTRFGTFLVHLRNKQRMRVDFFNIHRDPKEGSAFLFRPTVLVERVARVECIKEEDALRHFVRFLKNIGGNILIVGLDEETMGVLCRKLKKHSKKGNSVFLFTWWQRILKYRRFVSKKG